MVTLFTDRRSAPFSWNNWGKVTQKGNKAYLIIFNSTGSELCYGEIKNKVLSAAFLESGEAIDFEQTTEGRLFLRGLPVPLKILLRRRLCWNSTVNLKL